MPSFTQGWGELDEDLTLTRKMGRVADFAQSWEDITGVQVHPALVLDVTPVRAPRRELSSAAETDGGWTRDSEPTAPQPASTPYAAPLQSVTEVDVVPYGAMPSGPGCEPPAAPEFSEPPTRVGPHPQHVVSAPAPFVSSVPEQRSLPDLSRPAIRAPFDSDVSTWRKTIPALRRMVGLPIVPGMRAPMRVAPGLPMPKLHASEPAGGLSPLLSVAIAVSLVAMVVMTVIGFTSRSAEVGREARIRVVSASGPDGELLTTGKVFVDGAVQCEALPCELELVDGEHWVTVKAAGFETPPSRSVSMGSEQPARVHFELSPIAGSAPVVRTPSAVVAAAVAAPAALTLQPSPAVDPSAPSVAPSAPEPVVPARAKPAIRPAWRAPAMARLNINSIPSSSVVLDGRPVGRTPLMGLRVRPGAHTVVFVGPGGSRAVRGTSVSAGKTATVAARL